MLSSSTRVRMVFSTAGVIAFAVGASYRSSLNAETAAPNGARPTQLAQESAVEKLLQTPPQASGAAQQNQLQERAAAAAESGRPPAQPYLLDGRRTSHVSEYMPDGRLVRPVGWREWPFIGTPLTPNRLNLPEASFPEFHNVYIEPSAWEHFKRTGEFRDGTMFVKELVRQQENATTNPLWASTQVLRRL
jgi:hypothetical protein